MGFVSVLPLTPPPTPNFAKCPAGAGHSGPFCTGGGTSGTGGGAATGAVGSIASQALPADSATAEVATLLTSTVTESHSRLSGLRQVEEFVAAACFPSMEVGATGPLEQVGLDAALLTGVESAGPSCTSAELLVWPMSTEELTSAELTSVAMTLRKSTSEELATLEVASEVTTATGQPPAELTLGGATSEELTSEVPMGKAAATASAETTLVAAVTTVSALPAGAPCSGVASGFFEESGSWADWENAATAAAASAARL